MAAIGCGREAIHRAYFANLQGLDVGTVSAVAQSWFAAETASGAYYHAPTVDRLRRHQQRGDHIAILSGSFPALVLPMARDLGVEDVQCTQPEMIHGRYTGGFEGAPLIGPAKGAAARRAALRAGLDPGNCAAYADHLSDLPMLEAVGKAYVVGGGTALRALARARGWRLLDGPPEQPTPHQQAGMAMAPRLAV
ncbi:HAD-superfamily subfamily IB hydrolase, TIGR01490 [Streptomyces indicus]|uniref:HAD-superfamily subfamily IB hydrolase, TIGR01490 n=2 Tax=Streptomyces indicus TaxID=417292 RepID=A0A1G9HNC0_9ACTN|nr:HAD-superfamily subfamily IB hydrolase, TIGR01490 [Streptomyces indicus]